MKQFQTVCSPVTWVGPRPDIQKDAAKSAALIKKCYEEGFVLTQVTSSTVDNIMFVYHVFEK